MERRDLLPISNAYRLFVQWQVNAKHDITIHMHQKDESE